MELKLVLARICICNVFACFYFFEVVVSKLLYKRGMKKIRKTLL